MAAHAFQDWPKPYKVLLNLTVATLCVAALLALTMLPGWRRYQQYAEQMAEKEAEADARKWPKDSVALRRRLEVVRQELDGDGEEMQGLRQRSAEAIDRAAITFRPRILSAHISAADFMANVTRLDYKALYNEVEAELAADGLGLSAARLGLSEEENRTPVYQMIYKLWCVQRLYQLARAAGLSAVPDGDGKAQFVALPAHAYVVEADGAEEPYLLEFPTSVVLRGTLPQFRAFCGSLCTDTDFLPLVSLQVCTSPPAEEVRAGTVLVDTCDFTISCSAFFPPQ